MQNLIKLQSMASRERGADRKMKALYTVSSSCYFILYFLESDPLHNTGQFKPEIFQIPAV